MASRALVRKMNSSDLLTSKEVATYLRVCPYSLSKWRRQGSGPPFIHATSRKVLYSRAALDAWLNQKSRSEDVAAS